MSPQQECEKMNPPSDLLPPCPKRDRPAVGLFHIQHLQVSGQVQSLNDSLDEVKARLNTMEKALQSVQSQQQSIDAALQNMAAANPANAAPGTAANPDTGAPGAASPGSGQPPMQPATPPDNGGKPSAGVPFSAT